MEDKVGLEGVFLLDTALCIYSSHRPKFVLP